MSTPGQIPELRPEIVFLFDLVQRLTAGKIRVPRFQRPFVWRRDQMIDLLDSISKQYPIGSLLAWETDEYIASLSSVGPIRIKQQEAGSTVYLLDGHQRLSTIAGALVQLDDRAVSDEDDPSRWNLFFNARDRTFEHLNLTTKLKPWQFPMSKILDTFDFLAECQRVLSTDPADGKVYVERIQEIARAFQNYKIPVIQIKQTGLTEAVEIFARLNSKGQDMTADQMVSALLYRQDLANPFDLAREIDGSMEILERYGFGGVDRTLVLRSLLGAIKEDIYRTDWTRITLNRRQDLLTRLQDVMSRVNDSLEAAASFLVEELGVFNARLLPYTMQLTVLSSFFFVESRPSDQQRALLKRWFWVSSFTGWFGGANPSRVNALVRNIMDRVAVERERPALAGIELDTPAQPIPRSFDMRSARSRALLLVLLSLRPRDRFGQIIQKPENLIQLYGPEAVGYVTSRVYDRELTRSPANRILRDNVQEKGQARTWLLRCAPDQRAIIWSSHAVPLEAGDLLEQPDGSAFLQSRLDRLRDLEKKFMLAHGVTPPASDAPASAPIDTE